MSDRGKNAYSIQSVDNALDVLEALCEEGDEVRIASLSERLGMTKMSLFRYLATFENRGYVEHERGSGKYRLGAAAYEVGQKILSRMGLLRKARPVMTKLVRSCDEAVYIGIRRGDELLLLDAADTSQQVKIVSLVGMRSALDCSAAGRVLIAFSSSGEDERWRLPDLASIQSQGFALDHGALGEGISCVSVPLFGSGCKVQASLSFIGPGFRMTDETVRQVLLPHLQEAGQVISSKLGYFADNLHQTTILRGNIW